jgi:hypothetical protein
MVETGAWPDNGRMSMCPCPPNSLTAVSFDRGLRLLRCGVHEQQGWELDGRPLDRADVLENLRTVFTSRRGQRREAGLAVPTPAPARTGPAPAAEMIQLPHTDEGLTALLHARGLTGAWAIA